ncbi:MAG: DUF423 domain-containing protein [Alcaligenaceae bacterium]|nr:DUF423 domain-containing protein [Alcaligenaceae bacterium]
MLNIPLTAILGALAMATGVAAGAFGAHGLKRTLSADMLAIWQTAAHYQLIHGLGLLALAALAQHLDGKLASWSMGLMAAGIVVFSGSLYTLALSGVRTIGAITPIGGALFIAAWIMLILAAWRGAH